jgi:hypothetical protein
MTVASSQDGRPTAGQPGWACATTPQPNMDRARLGSRGGLPHYRTAKDRLGHVSAGGAPAGLTQAGRPRYYPTAEMDCATTSQPGWTGPLANCTGLDDGWKAWNKSQHDGQLPRLHSPKRWWWWPFLQDVAREPHQRWRPTVGALPARKQHSNSQAPAWLAVNRGVRSGAKSGLGGGVWRTEPWQK